MVTIILVFTHAKTKNLSKSVKVGDIVYFGKYEQDGNGKNCQEKIKWQVLDKKGNTTKDRVFLLSIDEAKSYFNSNEERV